MAIHKLRMSSRPWIALFGLAACLAASADPSAPNPDRPIEDELIYFVLPDRFANGDPGNDRGGYPADRELSGFDPTHKGFYHGGDLAGLRQRLDYIQGLGATAIWVAPIFKNKPVQGPPGDRSAGYHGYWITDFTAVDPHFGSEADFKALVEAAHARGMKVIMDIVVNHSADVIDYRECAPRAEGGVAAARSACGYRDRKRYPFTRRASDGAAINAGFAGDDPARQTEANFARLTDPGFAYTPFVRADEQSIKVPAWLNDPIYYHNRGNSEWQGESNLYGDFSGLDDINTEHPRVLAGMIDIFQDWISRYRVDGFRIDTARHVGDAFWLRFIPAILDHAKAQGIAHFYLFGESWALTTKDLARFTHQAAFPAVLDFAFQKVAREVIADGRPTKRLTRLFAEDRRYAGGEATAMRLPTFLGNHDMGRFGYFLQQAAGSADDLETLLARDRLGHVLLLTARGVPVIYSGDEQGFTGDGNDQAAREDLFESQVASYNDNVLIGSSASTAAANFDLDHPMAQTLRQLAALRAQHPVLRRGRMTVRLDEGRAGLFAYTRGSAADGEQLLIVLNSASVARQHVLRLDPETRIWQKLLGAGPDTLASAAGKLDISLPALAYAVYRSGK
ncbi:MAG: alpha-amylase family glycosyl hydrolase [Lysobacterales bacterium]